MTKHKTTRRQTMIHKYNPNITTIFGWVATPLAAIIYQDNPDRRHNNIMQYYYNVQMLDTKSIKRINYLRDGYFM